ncbi:DUF2846 domain-containing protein [Noviherbaspirillum galbum]|uniref:DUF2846 domain-containing protein n=1 Tax=Noviherbaspirillum galbum TaxID=2709383 RepID=A0A6B3SVA6_9BURK|nr:DUF2846 domain-containing protein [Noviherbaspirillum galbum]NEX63315.1 DUF2846 domain-containing protein [Noviherbaspirillum galbum]
MQLLIQGIATITVAALAAAMVSACVNVPVREGFVPCQRLERSSQCVTVSLASRSDDMLAKQFAPATNGMARIYLARAHTQAPTQRSTVFVDGRRIAQLAPLTFVVMDVPPGARQISIDTQGHTALLKLQASAGGLYFVEQRFDWLYNGVGTGIRLVESSEAQRKIVALQRVASLPAQAK